MNYEQMSDQQITDEITKRRGLNTEWHRWDFCNSWADMGQLIVENEIAILPYLRNSLWMTSRNGYRYHHTNPLRAAAILYLMMTEVGEC